MIKPKYITELKCTLSIKQREKGELKKENRKRKVKS